MTRRTLFVWLKEFLDHYRDRRSVFSLLVFPLFGPFLFGLILVGDRLLTPALTLGIVGIETVTESETLERGFLEKSIAVKYYPDPTSGRTALETGDVSGLLILKARPLSIEAALEATSQTLTTRSQSVIYLYNERLLQREIPDAVSPSLLRLEEIQASSRSRLLRFLPMFILVTIFYSGLHIALDSTAGERERGTWETLLMSPLSSGEIVIGKWLNATTFGSNRTHNPRRRFRLSSIRPSLPRPLRYGLWLVFTGAMVVLQYSVVAWRNQSKLKGSPYLRRDTVVASDRNEFRGDIFSAMV